MKYSLTTYDLGYKIENGVKRPLTEEENRKDRIYAKEILSQFTPKELKDYKPHVLENLIARAKANGVI